VGRRFYQRTRPERLFAADRGESLAGARDQIRGRESVQLGVTVGT
jgi:hypothetical protein